MRDSLTSFLSFVHALQQILRVEDADDVVGVAFVDRDPRVAGLDDRLEGLVERRVGRDRDHVGPRHHHLAHDGVAELEDRVDQLALFLLDLLLFLGDVDQVSDLVLRDERALRQRRGRAGSTSRAFEIRAGGRLPSGRRSRPSQKTGRATTRAARSVRCTVYVLGTTSAKTKIRNGHDDRGDRPRPRRRTPRARKRRGEHGCRDVSTAGSAAARRSGRGPGPRRSSTSAAAPSLLLLSEVVRLDPCSCGRSPSRPWRRSAATKQQDDDHERRPESRSSCGSRVEGSEDLVDARRPSAPCPRRPGGRSRAGAGSRERASASSSASRAWPSLRAFSSATVGQIDDVAQSRNVSSSSSIIGNASTSVA